MSTDIIKRIGADKILEVCKTVNTYKEACILLNCGYRYLVNALIKLNYYNEFNAKSQQFAKNKASLINLGLLKQKKVM